MSADNQPVAAEAADILDRVRAQVRFESVAPRNEIAVRLYTGARSLCRTLPAGGGLPGLSGPIPSGGDDELAAGIQTLHDFLESDLAIAMSRFGEMPASPRTLRGLFGRAVVRLIRALLWWYTQSLGAFGESVCEQFRRQAALLESLARRQAEYRAEVAALREEVRRLGGGPSGGSERR